MTLNYGAFINNVIAFIIVAVAVFMLVRMANRFDAKPAPAAPNTKPCPECTMLDSARRHALPELHVAALNQLR